MTTKALRLARRLASRHVFFVQFDKKDGSSRSMRLQYEGGKITTSQGQTRMQVRDLDLNDPRIITLDTIHVLTEAKLPQIKYMGEYDSVQDAAGDLFY